MENIKKLINETLNELKIDQADNYELSSLEIINFAVALEKKLHIKFSLNEISEEHFKNLVTTEAFLKQKLSK